MVTVSYTFIHIPRTGGNSIKEALSLSPQQLPEHHLPLKDRDSVGDFVFTFIRNPWDWLVSWYSYFKDNNRYDVSFDEWIKCGTPHHDSRFPVSQEEYFDESRVHFIGKFENLQKDLCSLLNNTQVTIAHMPKKLNKGNERPHYSKFYTPETKEIVGNMFPDFIKRWNYSFEEHI